MTELGLILAISVLGLAFAGYLIKWVLARDTGTAAMREVSDAIKSGALTPYFYHIHTTALSESEQAEWDKITKRIWLAHALHVVPVLAWLVLVCKMDLAVYVLTFVYPGTAILLIRSFAEHRASFGVTERTAIVENSWILGPLFLFNSLHSAHHTVPGLPWYELPRWYKANRDRLISENGGLVYNSYFDVARRYLFKPHDQVEHPFVRAP